MTSRSEDYEKGTVVVCGHDGLHELARASQRVAEQELVDAGYMTLIYAPSMVNVLPLWVLRFDPPGVPGERTHYNTWAPRWLVHSFCAVQGGGGIGLLINMLNRPFSFYYPCGADAFNPTGTRAETVEDRFFEIKAWLVENGLYREASE